MGTGNSDWGRDPANDPSDLARGITDWGGANVSITAGGLGKIGDTASVAAKFQRAALDWALHPEGPQYQDWSYPPSEEAVRKAQIHARVNAYWANQAEKGYWTLVGEAIIEGGPPWQGPPAPTYGLVLAYGGGYTDLNQYIVDKVTGVSSVGGNYSANSSPGALFPPLGGSGFYQYRKNGELIGLIDAKVLDNNTLYVDNFVVFSEQRDLGYATAILKSTIEHFELANNTKITAVEGVAHMWNENRLKIQSSLHTLGYTDMGEYGPKTHGPTGLMRIVGRKPR